MVSLVCHNDVNSLVSQEQNFGKKTIIVGRKGTFKNTFTKRQLQLKIL